jgi:hypothetical protein
MARRPARHNRLAARATAAAPALPLRARADRTADLARALDDQRAPAGTRSAPASHPLPSRSSSEVALVSRLRNGASSWCGSSLGRQRLCAAPPDLWPRSGGRLANDPPGSRLYGCTVCRRSQASSRTDRSPRPRARGRRRHRRPPVAPARRRSPRQATRSPARERCALIVVSCRRLDGRPRLVTRRLGTSLADGPPGVVGAPPETRLVWFGRER